MTETTIGPDNQARCKWTAITIEFIDYHDTEWGFPIADDSHIFEKLCLESFQSGLSWRTILAKRENFRRSFCGFDFNIIAQFNQSHVEQLLADTGIVRHRGKIEATINNAQRAVELVEEYGSIAAYFWRFEPDNGVSAPAQSPLFTHAAKSLAKDLKKRGWKFVGPTTVYAFMQSMGLINDHAQDCIIREKAQWARQAFDKPV